ncbi:hypothetical protein [Shewanella xiamenensis]|uniref:hypothetical protein n=1 Tax=Shewanella xiamenensis TaxID=332186 RepID=UPI001CC38EF9|nr:hypothetical protein [Shewanella xiamenensis]BDA63124.1 hypothetical protein NUITMVS1_45870 [Shewanella xiamenensis]
MKNYFEHMNTVVEQIVRDCGSESNDGLAQIINGAINVYFNKLSKTTQAKLAEEFENYLWIDDDSEHIMHLGTAALLLALTVHLQEGSTKELIDDLLDKHVVKVESMEFTPWEYFAEPLAAILSTDDALKPVSFYCINTAFRIGDTEGTVTNVVMCDWESPNTVAMAAEIAQAVSCGSFEGDLYAKPCFDRDGFITWPESITEITEADYNTMAKHIPTSVCLPEQELFTVGDGVLEYLKEVQGWLPFTIIDSDLNTHFVKALGSDEAEAKFLEEHPTSTVTWVVMTSNPILAIEMYHEESTMETAV